MYDEKIKTMDDLVTELHQRKERDPNCKIVTTNGSFDIMHIGHIYSLTEARKRGDILVVGLNSDKSVKSYKGPDRPINPEQYRAQFLAALECVDYVVLLDPSDVSVPLIEAVHPDVHVKSKSGYQGCEGPVLEKMGSELVLIEDMPGFSTSKILETLKNA